WRAYWRVIKPDAVGPRTSTRPACARSCADIRLEPGGLPPSARTGPPASLSLADIGAVDGVAIGATSSTLSATRSQSPQLGVDGQVEQRQCVRRSCRNLSTHALANGGFGLVSLPFVPRRSSRPCDW